MKIGIIGLGWLGLPLAKSLLNKGFHVIGTTRSRAVELSHEHFLHVLFDPLVKKQASTVYFDNLDVLVLALVQLLGRHALAALEDRTGGAYRPSPGVIYPTLTLLGDMGLMVFTADTNKNAEIVKVQREREVLKASNTTYQEENKSLQEDKASSGKEKEVEIAKLKAEVEDFKRVKDDLDKKYKKLGYPVIAINPNNPEKQKDDSFDKMKVRAKEKGFTFPYLFDDGQKIYPQYGATKTPHVYILQKTDKGNVVQYIGAIDDNHSDASAVKQKYVEVAVDALLKNQEVKVKTTKAIGCSIKA